MPQQKISREQENILATRIDHLSWLDAVERIESWARQRESRVVCICNVHSVVTAKFDRRLRTAINESDLATPDGMPLAWLIAKRRDVNQARISGADLTLRLCTNAAQTGTRIAFYGSSERTLAKLSGVLHARYPRLTIARMISPPFRALSTDEDEVMINALNESGAGIIFVGLGCPKQEIWMAEHHGRVNAVMIGVGAAFDYIAGTVKRPPYWMQRVGLEWLGRLVAEPRRLWRRYLFTNTIFIFYILRELIGLNKH